MSDKPMSHKPVPQKPIIDHSLSATPPDQEAENIRRNLWIFRLRRAIRRNVFASGVLHPGDYREIEYGHTPVTNDALAKLCDKYGLIEAELRAPPNYALLLDLPTCKLIEYSRVALTPRQRKSLIFMLRDFLPKRY